MAAYIGADGRLVAEEIDFQRAAYINRMVISGELDYSCLTCQREFIPFFRDTWMPGDSWPFAPRHKAGSSCKSGRHNHCTCDSCF